MGGGAVFCMARENLLPRHSVCFSGAGAVNFLLWVVWIFLQRKCKNANIISWLYSAKTIFLCIFAFEYHFVIKMLRCQTRCNLKGRSKNSEFRFLPILVFSVSAAFRPFRSHFVKSHQSHSPLCSFFNLQKHTQKKIENQLDIIFRTSLKCLP